MEVNAKSPDLNNLTEEQLEEIYSKKLPPLGPLILSQGKLSECPYSRYFLSLLKGDAVRNKEIPSSTHPIEGKTSNGSDL